MTLIPFHDLLSGKPKQMAKTASTAEAKDHAADAGDQTKKMKGQNYDPYEKAKKDSQAERDKQMKLAMGDDSLQIIRGLINAGEAMAGELSQWVSDALKYSGPQEGLEEEGPEVSAWDTAVAQAQSFLAGSQGPPNSLPGSEPQRSDPGSIGHTGGGLAEGGPGSYASFPEFDKEAGCDEPKKKPWDKKDEEEDK